MLSAGIGVTQQKTAGVAGLGRQLQASQGLGGDGGGRPGKHGPAMAGAQRLLQCPLVVAPVARCNDDEPGEIDTGLL